ncbi:hypothetical protein ACVWYG_002550 [Pedobacter sp. UYEF25]
MAVNGKDLTTRSARMVPERYITVIRKIRLIFAKDISNVKNAVCCMQYPFFIGFAVYGLWKKGFTPYKKLKDSRIGKRSNGSQFSFYMCCYS